MSYQSHKQYRRPSAGSIQSLRFEHRGSSRAATNQPQHRRLSLETQSQTSINCSASQSGYESDSNRSRSATASPSPAPSLIYRPDGQHAASTPPRVRMPHIRTDPRNFATTPAAYGQTAPLKLQKKNSREQLRVTRSWSDQGHGSTEPRIRTQATLTLNTAHPPAPRPLPTALRPTHPPPVRMQAHQVLIPFSHDRSQSLGVASPLCAGPESPMWSPLHTPVAHAFPQQRRASISADNPYRSESPCGISWNLVPAQVQAQRQQPEAVQLPSFAPNEIIRCVSTEPPSPISPVLHPYQADSGPTQEENFYRVLEVEAPPAPTGEEASVSSSILSPAHPPSASHRRASLRTSLRRSFSRTNVTNPDVSSTSPATTLQTNLRFPSPVAQHDSPDSLHSAYVKWPTSPDPPRPLSVMQANTLDGESLVDEKRFSSSRSYALTKTCSTDLVRLVSPASTAVEKAENFTVEPYPRRRLGCNRALLLFFLIGLLCLAGAGVGLGLCLGTNICGAKGTSRSKAVSFPAEGVETGPAAFAETGVYYLSSTATAATSTYSNGASVFSLTASNSKTADVSIASDNVYQTMQGIGSTLSDSSASLLLSLKQDNQTAYFETLRYLFNRRTGLSKLRVPIGSSDFTPGAAYTLADKSPVAPGSSPQALLGFNLSSIMAQTLSLQSAQVSLLPVLLDIVALRPDIKVHLVPFSLPTWLKDSNTLNGGGLIGGVNTLLIEYYAQSIKAFSDAKAPVHSFAFQNEPSKQSPTYPSMLISSSEMSGLALSLRTRLTQLGLSAVQIYANEDGYATWDRARDAMLTSNASSAFAGASFHCSGADPSLLANYTAALAAADTVSKDLMISECSNPTDGNRDWSSAQWWIQNVLLPLPALNVSSIFASNLALDQTGGPHLPQGSCQNCAGQLTISSTASFLDPFAELQSGAFAAQQQFAAATADLSFLGPGASAAARVATTVSSHKCLAAQAYAADLPTGGTQAQKRFGIMLHNSCDSASALSITIAIDNRSGTFLARPGLSTLQVSI